MTGQRTVSTWLFCFGLQVGLLVTVTSASSSAIPDYVLDTSVDMRRVCALRGVRCATYNMYMYMYMYMYMLYM